MAFFGRKPKLQTETISQALPTAEHIELDHVLLRLDAAVDRLDAAASMIIEKAEAVGLPVSDKLIRNETDG